VQRFRGGLVFKAHRLLYHSTLGLRVTKKKKKKKRKRRKKKQKKKINPGRLSRAPNLPTSRS